ncbi:restriction endonuclease subunit S [Candidatus Poseidoniales archaeon]|nr:restriction endonuclease subunit S [Candidatus Poseidoniales archaeon]
MELVELGELCTLIEERVEPKNLTCEQVVLYSIPSWDDGFPEVVSPDEIASSKFLVRQGDILISRLNPSKHKTWRVSEDIESEIVILASTEWGVVRPNQDVDVDYLHCALESPGFIFQMNAYVTGTTGSHQRVRMRDFCRLKIPLLSDPKSRKIGDIHRSFREHELTVSSTIPLIENMAHSLFKSWFIEFNPVRTKEAGGIPYGVNEETAELFPNSFEESKFGPIPKGWEWCELGDSISVVGGGTPSTKNPMFWDGEYNWTSPNDLSKSKSIIMLETEKTITKEGLKKISSGLLPVNTVLMSSRAPIGYLAITKIPVAINQGYIAIPPKTAFSPYFMASWIKFNLPLIEGYASGATFPEISKKEFRKLPLLMPPPEIVREFNNRAKALYDQVESCLRTSNSVAHLKDILTPRLVQ